MVLFAQVIVARPLHPVLHKVKPHSNVKGKVYYESENEIFS